MFPKPDRVIRTAFCALQAPAHLAWAEPGFGNQNAVPIDSIPPVPKADQRRPRCPQVGNAAACITRRSADGTRTIDAIAALVK